MTTIEELRSQARAQQDEAVRAQAPLFVRACPGAGKTRVLVERHCATEPGPRRTGRALLSFTNVAADELRERCTGHRGRSDLTAFPHYIGTFDSFLWRYLVRPFLPASPAWQHVLSWDQVPAAVVGPRRIPLSSFEFAYDHVTQHLDVDWRDASQSLHNSQLTKDDYCLQAARTRERLWQTNGYMTGLEVRIAALDHVRNPACVDLLTHRFFEIVVDEAQDCSALDLAILAHLHKAGLPLVIMADTDQGIYEWNDARPEDLNHFTRSIPEHLELTGNWRSSPTICALAATLRPPHRGTSDLSVGEHCKADLPVLLLPYGKNRKQISGMTDVTDAGEAFIAWAALDGIAPDDCLALAHSNSAVPKVRSQPAPKLPKSRDALALAWCRSVFAKADASPRARSHALAVATEFLCAYWYPDHAGTVADLLTREEISPALIRRRAATFLDALPPDTVTAREWRSRAREVLAGQLPGAAHAPVAAPARLYVPNADLDKPMRSLIGLSDPGEGTPPSVMRSSSVHQAKGSEAEAVLLHIPRPQALLDKWADPSTHTATSELLRVHYVAVTRARRLLSLTYPYSKHDGISELLELHKINYRVETAPPTGLW